MLEKYMKSQFNSNLYCHASNVQFLPFTFHSIVGVSIIVMSLVSSPLLNWNSDVDHTTLKDETASQNYYTNLESVYRSIL